MQSKKNLFSLCVDLQEKRKEFVCSCGGKWNRFGRSFTGKRNKFGRRCGGKGTRLVVVHQGDDRIYSMSFFTDYYVI